MMEWFGVLIAVLLSPWIARWGWLTAGACSHCVTGKFWSDEFSPDVRAAADDRATWGG